jgi:hypothetical protein
VHIRLIVCGEVEPGTNWEFWKDVADARAAPRVGDQIELGAAGGAAHHLTVREVVAVEWTADLGLVRVRLADLHAGWLQANRREFHDAGWMTAVAG